MQAPPGAVWKEDNMTEDPNYQYTAHATPEYNYQKRRLTQPPAPVAQDRFERPVKIFVGFAVALVLCSILAVLLFGLSNLADRRQNAVVAAVEVSITPLVIDSSTPQLTATPEPSRTPWPTVTVSDNREVEPIIKYEVVNVVETVIVEVPVVTEIVIERVITPTGEPTATTDATATVAAWEFIDRRSDQRRANFWGWVGSILAAGLIFGGLAWYIIGMVRAGIDRRLEQASGETELEQVRQAVADQVARHPLADIPAEKRLHIVQLWRAGRSQRFIEQTVYGYTGGDAYEYVKRVIDYHVERGVAPHPAETDGEEAATQAS